MKKLVFALVAALLIAGQFITPAAAASSQTVAASTCGDTYIVQRGDYLTLIARRCGITYRQILNYNPQIRNPSRIYPGQVIRLTAGAGIPPTGTGDTYVVRYGDTLREIAARFGTSVWAILQVNPQIWNPSLIFAGQVIRLPDGISNPGDPGLPPPPVTGRYVTISSRYVKAGGAVTVTVRGFPANAEIDYRIGKQGAAYTAVVDGKTDANGNTSATVTIPTSAVVGEHWVVIVQTTSIKNGVQTTSPVITITQ
jgi:LysM repeat protein